MYRRILVPIDGSPIAERGLKEALALARSTGGQVRLLHVVDEVSFAVSAEAAAAYAADLLQLLHRRGDGILAAAQEQARAAGVPCDTAMRDGLAGRLCDLVIEEATRWPADLIVIGTHGRRGAQRLLLGSDAEQILRLSPVPVLLVRAVPPSSDA
ncbi:MAG: universal stress protein [Aquabacterium sp.]|jgi:nucleotide-binding universal stress UspA family protein|nr:MAG: universal stress protein [Aquabacterium sp.]TAL16807.1 MAG: universal stress protein [Aquabacterium sp.]